MPDEQRRHQWTFLLEPTSPNEPRSILTVCTECGLLRQHAAGRSKPRVGGGRLDCEWLDKLIFPNGMQTNLIMTVNLRKCRSYSDRPWEGRTHDGVSIGMQCRCATTDRLEGSEAASYAMEHLRLVSVDNDSWDAIYRCATTGAEWAESFPQGELHGGGPPLLMRHSAPTQGQT